MTPKSDLHPEIARAIDQLKAWRLEDALESMARYFDADAAAVSDPELAGLAESAAYHCRQAAMDVEMGEK